jgi:hypothetical protein
MNEKTVWKQISSASEFSILRLSVVSCSTSFKSYFGSHALPAISIEIDADEIKILVSTYVFYTLFNLFIQGFCNEQK